ncbi:MAG TPA: hypothetical protein VFP98_00115, partial [Candidatus Polarisedimenticolia bacterium]|nr:hypothetical protein [Candidatus Polarisedimenticolia bacterium]
MRPHSRRFITAVALAALLAAPVTAPSPARAQAPVAGPELPREVDTAMRTISSGRIRAHMRFLSDDLLEGRGTGARGGDIAAAYIAAYLNLSALWPGGPGNSYLQKVPLVGAATQEGSRLEFTGSQSPVRALTWKDDFVLWTETQKPQLDSSGEVVFVGYGVVAPEHSWDDYKGVDVTGKVLLMLVNDPPSE